MKPSSKKQALVPKADLQVVKTECASQQKEQELEKVEKLSHAFSSLSQVLHPPDSAKVNSLNESINALKVFRFRA